MHVNYEYFFNIKHCVGETLKSSSITVLTSLHWLPVKYIIHFINFFIYQALYGLAPRYIADLLKPYSLSRSLHSCNQLLRSVPRSRLKTKGDRALSVAAPKQWNALPVAVRSLPTLAVAAPGFFCWGGLTVQRGC